MQTFAASELILNPDGSIYHLHLRPEHIAPMIITVGDPNRVEKVSKHFDQIEFKGQKREFVTHTGYIGKQRITVISTGIGTDNIDIVLNELDALANIDLISKKEKEQKTSLQIIRIGTSGTVQEDIDVDSLVVGEYGLGLDTLLNFYDADPSDEEKGLKQEIVSYINKKDIILPYLTKASEELIRRFPTTEFVHGITASCCGFYAPQGRHLRARPAIPELIDSLSDFYSSSGKRITNLEMETAAIYGLGKILGHHCLSVNAILANRKTGKFSSDPAKAEEKAIRIALEYLLR